MDIPGNRRNLIVVHMHHGNTVLDGDAVNRRTKYSLQMFDWIQCLRHDWLPSHHHVSGLLQERFNRSGEMKSHPHQRERR
jgi:hypothetical protein